MTAFNVVRMRTKPDREADFLEGVKTLRDEVYPGQQAVHVVKTGDRSYCFIGEWRDMNALIAARPEMIGNLDRLRDTLEDLGGGLGVTDPVSGETVFDMRA